MQPLIWVAGDFVLAFVPVVLAGFLACGVRRDARSGRMRWPLWSLVGLLWLVFLPNTAYLLTEWRHYLRVVTANPVYTHLYRGEIFPPGPSLALALFTAFYVVYTGAGLIALFFAVRPLDQLMESFYPHWQARLQGSIFLLCSFGVFLGFVEKLNSWQISSGWAFAVVARGARHVLAQPALLIIAVGFAGFLWAVYQAMVVFERGWLMRTRGHTRA